MAPSTTSSRNRCFWAHHSQHAKASPRVSVLKRLWLLREDVSGGDEACWLGSFLSAHDSPRLGLYEPWPAGCEVKEPIFEVTTKE